MVANTFNFGRQRQADSLFEARLGYRVPGKLQRNPVSEGVCVKGSLEIPKISFTDSESYNFSPGKRAYWMSKCQSSRMQACSTRTPTVLVSLQLLSLATTMRTAIFRNSFSFFYPKANSSNAFATLRSRGQTSLSSPPPCHGQPMALSSANASASSEMTHSAPQSQTQTPRRRSRQPLSRVERSRCTISLNHADIFLPAASRSAPPVFGHPC